VKKSFTSLVKIIKICYVSTWLRCTNLNGVLSNISTNLILVHDIFVLPALTRNEEHALNCTEKKSQQEHISKLCALQNSLDSLTEL